MIYPVLLLVASIALVWKVSHRATTEVWIERISGPSFVELPDGRISAQVRIKLENESDTPRTYHFSLVDTPRGELRSALPTWQAAPRKAIDLPLFVDLPRDAFRHGELKVQIRIDDDAGFERIVQATLLGPEGGGR